MKSIFILDNILLTLWKAIVLTGASVFVTICIIQLFIGCLMLIKLTLIAILYGPEQAIAHWLSFMTTLPTDVHALRLLFPN